MQYSRDLSRKIRSRIKRLSRRARRQDLHREERDLTREHPEHTCPRCGGEAGLMIGFDFVEMRPLKELWCECGYTRSVETNVEEALVDLKRAGF